MKLIKTIGEMVEDELEGAEHYAKEALMYRESHPLTARVFYEISLQEMNHVNMLHGEVVKLIEAYRKEHGEPPAAMTAVYDYLHKRHIEEAKEVKLYQSQYRGE